MVLCHCGIPIIDAIIPETRFTSSGSPHPYFLLNVFTDAGAVCIIGMTIIMMKVLMIGLNDFHRLKGNELADKLHKRGSILLYKVLPGNYVLASFLIIINNVFPCHIYTLVRVLMTADPAIMAGYSFLVLSIENKKIWSSSSSSPQVTTVNAKKITITTKSNPVVSTNNTDTADTNDKLVFSSKGGEVIDSNQLLPITTATHHA